VAGRTKTFASRFYQIKTGTAYLGSTSTGRRTGHPCSAGGAGTGPRPGTTYSGSAPGGGPQQKILWAEVRKGAGRWKSRWRIRDLMADARCSRAVSDFLTSTDVGRRAPVEEDAESETSERELRERRERGEEREAEAEDPRAARELRAREELLLFLPTPSFIASAGDKK